jgi:isocitrate dehydrogenase
MATKVALAKGDGIGPEITEAVLRILTAAGVPIEFEPVDMGYSVFKAGHSTGMTPQAQETIERLGVLFKGPMETPKGKGVKSINVTARKVWNTYANKRVFRSLEGVETPFSRAGIPINITIVRENIEDTYGGIEHFLTHDVALCRRFITRPGSEQVHRYTFEMARAQGFAKVTCGHKANIMKLTDGLFLETFREVAKEYPEIEANDIIVDDLAMKLVRRPDQFQVIVLPNLQGDIISDLCAGLVGGLGFAPSANIGDHVSIFEAVHGTAPDIAGKGIANPISLLMSGLMMLRHLGFGESARRIESALFTTLKQGMHTPDFGASGSVPCSTDALADAIIGNLGAPALGDEPRPDAGHANRTHVSTDKHRVIQSPRVVGEVAGIDLFVESDQQPGDVATAVSAVLPSHLSLTLISNRGTQVWPTGSMFTDCVNQYRVRVEVREGEQVREYDMHKVALAVSAGMRVCSTEILMRYGGNAAYSLAQGQ